MAEFKQGDMDIREQEKTFAGFIRFAVWTAGIAIFALILLALLNA